MTDDPSFVELLDVGAGELEAKTFAHQIGWGLGKFERWDIDMDQGDLIFSNYKGMDATCPAQVIGTFNQADSSWLWAWANPSIPDERKLDSLKVKQYGEIHRIPRLTERKWIGEEMDAWRMTALAVKLCEAQGAYRGPAGTTAVFMTFGAVRLSKAAPARKGWRWPWSK